MEKRKLCEQREIGALDTKQNTEMAKGEEEKPQNPSNLFTHKDSKAGTVKAD